MIVKRFENYNIIALDEPNYFNYVQNELKKELKIGDQESEVFIKSHGKKFKEIFDEYFKNVNKDNYKNIAMTIIEEFKKDYKIDREDDQELPNKLDGDRGSQDVTTETKILKFNQFMNEKVKSKTFTYTRDELVQLLSDLLDQVKGNKKIILNKFKKEELDKFLKVKNI